MNFLFLGTQGRTYSFSLDSNAESLNLYDFALSKQLAITNAARVEIVVPVGITVIGKFTGESAIVTGTGWNAGTELVLTVRGTVSGRGGAGGNGGSAEIPSAPTVGENGGVAITISRNLTIVNEGLIQGGTGGGGGGGTGPGGNSEGGGGGGGAALGTGGIGGIGSAVGSLTDGGSGGTFFGQLAGNGGKGGSWLDSGTGVGADGTTVAGGSGPGGGGSPGAAIVATAGTATVTGGGTLYGVVP